MSVTWSRSDFTYRVLFDPYPNLTMKTHYISVARHIITIATGTKRYLSLKYDENASFDIILPITVVICLVIAISCDIFYFSATMLPLLRRR